jgi:hypothetical protein
MIRNDRIINSLVYGDMVQRVSQELNIGLTEARELISEMSFKEYRALEEASADITPPSGQKLGGSTAPAPGVAPAPAASNAPIQSGTGNPPGQQSKPAQTGPQATPAVPGQQVPGKPPIPGQQQVPGQVQQQVPGKPPIPGQVQQQAVAEDQELIRMCQLAGIAESCSGGATGAGAIAIAPTAMGSMKRREVTTEQKPVEYERTEAPKTIVGDTKPAQASGKLSADLAARGKKTASRNKNGLRR